MASLTQWTWVWVNSGSWWWTEAWRAAVLGVAKSQTQLRDWTTKQFQTNRRQNLLFYHGQERWQQESCHSLKTVRWNFSCYPVFSRILPFRNMVKTALSESEVTQPCLAVGDPMDCSPPGSSVHGLLQARILKWAAMPFSRRSWPRDRTWVSCIAGKFFTIWGTRKGWKQPDLTAISQVLFNQPDQANSCGSAKTNLCVS